MAEYIDFEELKRKADRQALINKVKGFAWTAWDHRYEILGGIIVGGGIIKGGINTVSKITDARDKKRRVWDPSEGHYWKTKKELTNAEYLEMEAIRKRCDCSKGKALEKMGLLKK